MALEDVTKTGPVGLKGLKGVDRINEMTNEEYDTFISSFTPPSRDAIRLAGALSMEEDMEFSTGQDLGDSRYDKPILSQEEVENVSEYRALEQAWYDQLANGLGKAVVLAGTTFIDSTLGTIVGATTAATEQKFSNLWDNPISRAMLEINEWSERVLPNYYSEEEQRNNANGEWYKNVFTANFWGDKFLKNMGFTVGAVATGAATGSLLKGAIGKAAKYTLGKQASDAAIQNASSFVRANVGAAVASIGESKIEALHSANDWYDLQKAKLDDKYKPLFASLEQYKQEPDLYNSLASSVNEEYELELAKLNDLKAKVGNVTFGLNVPLTYGTNMLAWGKLFSGGYNTAASSINISKRLGKYVSDSSPISIIKGPLSEGTQEISQKAASVISGLKYESELENFYNSELDSDANQETLSWMKAFAKGISDTVSDPNSWEEFTLGALTGAFGMPMIRRNKGKLSLNLEGGIIGDYREYKKQKDLENSMVDALNSRIESEDFKNYYDGITRHIKYQNDMNEAAENKDAFAYKNAEDSQLISDIIMFDKAGRLNDLVEMINDATELSDENIQSIIDNTTDADGNGPFSQNGNALPKDEIVKKINERKDNILKQIDDYRKLKDVINREIGDKVSDSQLEELTWLLSKSRRNSDRIGELSKDVNHVLRSVLAEAEQQMPNETQLLENLRSLVDASPEELAFILKSNPEVVQFIKEYAKEVDNKYNLNFTEEANKIDDIVKLYNTIQDFNRKYKEYSENPTKQAEDKAKSRDKASKVNKASEDIKKKDNIVDKSVSEINEAIDNGDMTEDDLLSMFPEGLPSEDEMSEVESKAKSALDIRNKTNKIKAEIDKSDADDMTKNNAKKLIDNSRSLSDSLDDLTDLSSEAFNDPSFMYDELDPSLQGLDRDALQDEVEIRLGGAKNLLSEMISIVEDNEGKLEGIPNVISDETKESSIGSTGHDSVDKNEPINKSKVVKTVKGTLADNLIQQAIDESNDSPTVNTLRDVIKDIDRLVNAGAVEKTIKKTIYNSASYKKAVEGFPGLVQSIDKYISDKLQEKSSKTSEVKEEKPFNYNPLIEDDILTIENSLSSSQNSESHKPLDKAESTGGVYTSWLSPVSKYYRYSPKGDRTAFDQVAEGMNYTPEKLKRVKAIWNYLDRHNAFDYVNQGNVKVGDKIEFSISETLNTEAGELVIILRKDDHVVGVLPSSNDREFSSYAGLSDFVELIKNEYESLGNPASFTSKYTTSVNKNMVGRVPYTSNENNTLNSIFTNQTSSGGNTNIPFELGISSGDGRNAEIIISSVRKGTSRNIKDKQRTIMSPLDAKKGQPYLLVRTSDPKRAFVPVPFGMPYYSQYNSNSALGVAIDNVLNSLVGLQAKDIMKVKRELQELLAIPELHINVLKNGNLKIDAKFQGDDKQTNIYIGKIDNPNLVQEVKSKLYGTPFQVSRKYINDTYKGQDYNRMIGELAYTNIDGTHTIDDWFTINPVDKEGKEFKGKTFKSTRNNPNSARPQFFDYNWKGIPIKVNLETFEVFDASGKEIKGKNVDKAQALAYGFKTSKTGIYKSPWGWFNSETLEFVDEPKQENIIKKSLSLEEAAAAEKDNTSNTEAPSRPEANNTFASPEELEDKARKEGLLSNPKRRALWKVLNNSQQETLLNTKGMRREQLMKGLELAYDVLHKNFNMSKLKGSIENYLGMKPLYRKTTESKEQLRKKEIKWLSRAFPNLSEEGRIKVVNGLIKVAAEDGGGFAWGQFKQGVITLSNLAARGTVYHEAFHAVTHTLLSDSEYDELFKVGREKYGDLSEIAIEEKLAEDFRRYMQLEEMPFVGRVVRIFRTLKHIIQNLLGKESYLNKLYYNINNSVYSNRQIKDSSTIRNKEYIPYQILEQELDKFKYDYALVTANRQLFERGFSSTYLSDVKNYINSKDLSMVLYPYFRNGRYHVGIISKDRYNREVQNMTRGIQESMYYGKPLYRRVISDEVKNDCATFLANFGIKIEELQDYNSDVPLFDAINRVINVRSNEDITKGTAYAVAFMMQHHKTMNELIILKAGAESNLKNLRRSLRVRGDYEARMSKDARRGLKVENYIDEISDDIANELNKFYNNQTIDSNSNIIKKIWDVITNFFELLTPGARARFNVLHDYTRYIANAIILNDKSIILSSEHKPESNTELIEYKEGKEKAVLVNLEEAFRENPYEESIVTTLNKEGISLAGGASIAAERSLYRPADNPLHDLDFNARQYSREQIKGILDKHYPNNTFIRHIKDDKYPDVRYTDTFLIMDRPFEIRKDTGLAIYGIYDKETGEHLGSYTGSELVLNEGINGKFLDFFMGEDAKPFPDKKMIFNGKEYLIANAKNALRAKAEWHRPKDIWDYARYIPEEMQEVIDLSAVERENKYKEKLQNAKIIWGHPAIGKTTYLETHDDIVEWDELINSERNLFFREQIDPEHKLDMNSSEYKQLRSKYMSEWKEHPEYIEFLKEKWEWLKNKAKRENKRIFASPAPLLELFKDDFDLFVVLPEKEFMIRNQQRGGQYYASLGWKQIVNEKLINVDRSKILETSDYFSDFMKKYSLEEGVRELEQHHREKYMLGNLSNEDKQFLIDKGISIEEYNRMSPFEREVLFHCR